GPEAIVTLTRLPGSPVSFAGGSCSTIVFGGHASLVVVVLVPSLRSTAVSDVVAASSVMQLRSGTATWAGLTATVSSTVEPTCTSVSGRGSCEITVFGGY